MELDKIIVLLLSILGIGFTYWFFLMKKEEVVKVSGTVVEVLVDGGYKPSSFSIKKNTPTTLTFLRKDPSSCLEEVVLPDFKKRAFLPLNKKISIEITAKKAGEYDFACGMNMFHGKIVVSE